MTPRRLLQLVLCLAVIVLTDELIGERHYLSLWMIATFVLLAGWLVHAGGGFITTRDVPAAIVLGFLWPLVVVAFVVYYLPQTAIAHTRAPLAVPRPGKTRVRRVEDAQQREDRDQP